jgi:uncharacterized membrane protein
MSTVPVQVIVAAFNDEKAADEVLDALKAVKKEKLIGIKDAAILRRDAKNKIHIKDVRDVGGGKGAVAGAVIGTGIALLTGGVGIVLSGAAGALVGGLTAKNVDMGLSNKRLKEMGEALKPGTSAIIAVVEHTWVRDLEEALAAEGAQVMTEALKADISAQLEAGKSVAYSAIAAEGGASVSRVAGDEEAVELSDITVTNQGVAAKATVVTKEGVATKGLVLTDEGLVAHEAVVTAAGAVVAGVAATAEGAVGGVAVITPEESAETAAGGEAQAASEEQPK